ncbi:MAG: hypothetical protein KatS3mg111_1745 [Pirellulaceae bacterium]|nr:MAG: hypothetical protein KatS3mg111_1745 [Pirellulaceae bacterium]
MRWWTICGLVAGAIIGFSGDRCCGQGIILPAGGAVNRAMGGATTGTAIEAIGSMYWNPATITRLQSHELAFGFEGIYNNIELSSTFPNAGSGSSRGEQGVTPVPTIAWVHHLKHYEASVGVGLMGVAGFGTNLRADPSNPLLSPPPSLGGVGVGGIRSDALFFQLNPNLAWKLSDRLSVAVGPVVTMGKIVLDQNSFVAPNADGSYPRGDGTRYHWGMGAQVGVHCVMNDCWELGANVKTPTWFEPFRYFSEDVAGLPRTDKVNLTLPMVVSGGLAYRGFDYVVLTTDVRYFDYTSTEAFGDPPAYGADGRVQGLGWKDVFSVAVGVQMQLTDHWIARGGYLFATDLFDDSATFFNVASDLSYQHVPSAGFTYKLSSRALLSASYQYVASWSSTGPYILAGLGPIPGSSVTTDSDAHIATVGVNVRY